VLIVIFTDFCPSVISLDAGLTQLSLLPRKLCFCCSLLVAFYCATLC